MIRFLMMGLLLYIGYRIVISLTSAKKTPTQSSGNGNHAAETYRDPVCGVYVSEEDAIIGKYDGRRYYFCSMACLEKFREQPDHTPPP